MSLIYLIGTHHLDLKGPERLEKLLGFIRPDSIAIESDEKAAKKRVEDHDHVVRQLTEHGMMLRLTKGREAADKISNYLSMLGYELWSPESFARTNPGTSLLYVDDFPEEQASEVRKDFFRDKVKDSGQMNENFIDDIIKINLDEYQREIDASYDHNSVEEFRRKDPETFERLIIGRDKQVEPKIREAFKSTSQNLVYVGGSIHFFGEYNNLYDRLKDLNPIRLKLKEADKF